MRSHLGRRLRRIGLYALALGLAPLAVAELATRALVRVDPGNGMATFFGIPLLPHRPTPDAVREWEARTATSTYVTSDRDLGWSLAPNGSTPDGLYESNAQTARAPRDVVYATDPPPGKVRVVAVGDSFTHGDRVGFAETWLQRLAALRAELETVNFGVPGYGTDQAVLRWRRDASRLRADLAILGIWPEDLCRNLNLIRYFLQPGGGFAQKPRFLETEQGLRVIGQPVLEGDALLRAVTEPLAEPLLAHDRWLIADDVTSHAYQRLAFARVAGTLVDLYERRASREKIYSAEDPSGIAVTVAMASQWSREVAATGAAPVVVLIPMRELVERYAAEDSFPLLPALRAAGVESIDLFPPMATVVRERGAACCFLPDGHLSAEGNDLVARWLAERLAARIDRARRS